MSATLIKKNKLSILELAKSEAVKNRFTEVTGKNPEVLTSAIVTVMSENNQLKDCSPNSILSAIFSILNLNLRTEISFGQAYIIPYNGQATFQLGWRGYVQLAIRTGLYKTLHTGEIYEGEIRGKNPLTGEFIIGEKISDEIIGYAAHFELVSGFQKTLFMSKTEMENHAKKFAKNSSVWKKNFDAMAKKTVLKLLLKNWGVLDSEMQQALKTDFDFQNEINITPTGTNEFIDITGDEQID